MFNFFIFFLILQVFTSTFIYFSINPIYSILLLILLFFESAVLLSVFNLEFMSILFILIYVGAIAILFLFVIMMLQLKLNNLEILFFLPVTISLNIVIFLLQLAFLQPFTFTLVIKKITFEEDFNELFILGQFLYNYSVICLILAGILLLLALIGSIIISLDFSKLKFNIIFKKISRTSNFITFFK